MKQAPGRKLTTIISILSFFSLVIFFLVLVLSTSSGQTRPLKLRGGAKDSLKKSKGKNFDKIDMFTRGGASGAAGAVAGVGARAMGLRGSASSSATGASVMPIPPLLYGTAWKKQKTEELVRLAVETGFRGIDTACQPKHYYEKGVGDALAKLYEDGIVTRNDIFLQTKFTPINGQDPNDIPYDKNAPLEEQVLQSFEKSKENLRTDYLNSLVLHSPMSSIAKTLTVWKVFEQIHATGGVQHLGISNCYDLDTLEKLYENANVKPSYLQNRFYRESGYDVEIRKFCDEHNIRYQSFWTLTANPNIVESQTVQRIAQKYSKTTAQIWFAFVRSLGITVLSGTKSKKHMLEDLEIPSITLTEEEMNEIGQYLQH